MDFSALNGWGWFVFMYILFGLLFSPLMFDKPREPYRFSTWLLSIAFFVVLLLALGVLPSPV